MVGIPEVTSAHIAGSVLLLVVDQKVYVYDYEANSWNASIATKSCSDWLESMRDINGNCVGVDVRKDRGGPRMACTHLVTSLGEKGDLREQGIEHPVSHISGDNCCYSGHPFCVDISNSVFAYLHGDQISQTHVYFSNTRGYTFQKFAYERQVTAELAGSLGGVFYFHSLSQVGLLLIDQGKVGSPAIRQPSPGTGDRSQPAYYTGGLGGARCALTGPVGHADGPGPRVLKAMFSYSEHPLNRSLGLPFDYNGTLDILITPGQKGILIFWFEKSLLVSGNAGQLVYPVPMDEEPRISYSSISEANVTIHNIAANQNELAVLTRENSLYYGSLGILPSSLIKVELLQGEFDNRMYSIDMNSKLQLTALMIPRPGRSPVPLAMVSNPHSLGLQVAIYEDGYTYDGNTKHRLNISLRQQHHWGRANPNFTSSIKKPTVSTITLDVANKEISCVDLKPLTALISVGCDQEKKIVIQNKISACSNGILDPVGLQDNYSYIIEKEAYDPNFRGQMSREDLVVNYRYEKLGCPRLVYYNTPWRPVVELPRWREGKFQEVTKAEFVLLEVNGLFTYTYSLTAQMALCRSQPQNWTTILESAGDKRPFAWDRENYISCHDPDNDAPLRWPDVPYQILGGPTANKVIFDQRNGIYVFFLSIVDPYYSYCHLETTFSVYVYGALPPSIIPTTVTIIPLIMAMLLSVWSAYMIPKLLHTEKGLRLKEFWMNLCRRLRNLCPCFQGRR
ncbi:cation channel sperm-associated protein subunit delta isoform X3 [Prionailurus iriomotensis]